MYVGMNRSQAREELDGDSVPHVRGDEPVLVPRQI